MILFKRFLSINCFFLLSVLSLQAKTTEASSLMWSVETDYGKAYMLGSIHLADSTLYPLRNEIVSAYESSDYLVVEINMLDFNMMEYIKLATLQDGSTLKDHVSEEHYEMLQEAFKANGLPERAYEKFKPWLASIMLMQLKMTEAGISAEYGLDMHFLNKADADNKPILQLETVQSQAQTFDAISDLSDEYIDYSLESLEVSEEDMKMLIKAWRTGDVDTYQRIMLQDEDLDHYKEVMDIILVERNKKMAKKIADYLKEDKTYFIIVGAAHLIGGNSIQDFLMKIDDFKIKRH